MSIPKKIHWCWLSGDPLPKNLQACLNSWQRVMPDYEVICWDMRRFDIHSVPFVADACAARKWAFAADYIRLYALYTEGGVYLDSDVRVFRKFDKFLNHAAFSGIEHHSGTKSWAENEQFAVACNAIQAAVIGAEKGNVWIKECMDYYLRTPFKLKPNGEVDVEISPVVLARCAAGYGFRHDAHFNDLQELRGGIVIYPQKVFATAYAGATMRSHALHLCDGSWYKKGKPEPLPVKWDRILCSRYRFCAMLHYQRKRWLSRRK
ncbi:MAG: polysaccharide biosynthesis protein [Bacteroidales bacterium]|jgi:hypothetical protein|nr:polysaccharide biosynthesis protein [Bacteroidales bacterium]